MFWLCCGKHTRPISCRKKNRAPTDPVAPNDESEAKKNLRRRRRRKSNGASTDIKDAQSGREKTSSQLNPERRRTESLSDRKGSESVLVKTPPDTSDLKKENSQNQMKSEQSNNSQSSPIVPAPTPPIVPAPTPSVVSVPTPPIVPAPTPTVVSVPTPPIVPAPTPSTVSVLTPPIVPAPIPSTVSVLTPPIVPAPTPSIVSVPTPPVTTDSESHLKPSQPKTDQTTSDTSGQPDSASKEQQQLSRVEPGTADQQTLDSATNDQLQARWLSHQCHMKLNSELPCTYHTPDCHDTLCGSPGCSTHQAALVTCIHHRPQCQSVLKPLQVRFQPPYQPTRIQQPAVIEYPTQDTFGPGWPRTTLSAREQQPPVVAVRQKKAEPKIIQPVWRY
ncbi:proteoglycan 4 isoform X4 [Octopus bimaculoides]|uniref:proteoglycan 4 isoform X4 n=1 Tax=Octopus bimaculoides TaxID=37653 RepID=UPI00071E2B32|nr:proteoglycan 4 isoform X4 [Octopus bimaculoides]|eukprot:XP_014773188.1 PREDICTED: proteoglycan 4-like isoform X3 [Octopus bimaculoides]